MSISGLPFDDVRQLIADLPAGDENVFELTSSRNLILEQQFGSLGDHKDWLNWLAKWSGKSPLISRPLLALFAGTHAIAGLAQDVEYEETHETVTRLAAGGSPANQTCAVFDVGLKVFDLALQHPVGDVSSQDALDEKSAAATIGFGMEAIAGNVDILGLAGFGKASEITNAALLYLLFDLPIEAIFERFSIPLHSSLVELVNKVVERHHDAKEDVLELLRRLGGREHNALAGAILAARTSHIPVLLSGLTAITVAALLDKHKYGSCDHCMIVGSCFSPSELNKGLAHLPRIISNAGNLIDGSAIANAVGLLKGVCTVHNGSVIEV